jgi:hypothetical protein
MTTFLVFPTKSSSLTAQFLMYYLLDMLATVVWKSMFLYVSLNNLVSWLLLNNTTINEHHKLTWNGRTYSLTRHALRVANGANMTSMLDTDRIGTCAAKVSRTRSQVIAGGVIEGTHKRTSISSWKIHTLIVGRTYCFRIDCPVCASKNLEKY